MLITLRVKNLALVENVKVDFTPGLNMITGETGAGKSLLIGALNLLLGERADKKIIRSGADRCGVEAVFQLKKTSFVDGLLDDLGIAPCENKQLIVRRLIKASGASQNLVNDTSVTLQALKKLGEHLIDMHGSYDHQSLLYPDFQLSLLDAYGQLDDERKGYYKIFTRCSDLESRRADLQGNDQDIAAQIDLLTYRIKEIEEANPVEGEEEEIQKEHILLSNAQKIADLGGNCVRLLTEGESSAFDAFAVVQRSLEELAPVLPEAQAWLAEARTVAVQTQELSKELGGFISDMEADPIRLTWLEQRMAVYQKLRRKYAATVSEIRTILEESKQRRLDLETRDEQLSALEKELNETKDELRKKGILLRKLRKDAAGQLARAVSRELRELGFPHGCLNIQFHETEPRPDGLDRVEFGFAPNVGEASLPLRDIASSGEISRIMLALKAVLAAHDKIPVLIFDEIDANIGGEIGGAVGRKLGELAQFHQIICITHLPQVAIFGKTHFSVTKRIHEQRTLTEMQCLDSKARVEEIARMLGGRDMTSVTLQHAREMLQSV